MIAWHDGSLAVSPIPVKRVLMVIGQRANLKNKPAATRPDASDISNTEATSMVSPRSNSVSSPDSERFVATYLVYHLTERRAREEWLLLREVKKIKGGPMRE